MSEAGGPRKFETLRERVKILEWFSPFGAGIEKEIEFFIRFTTN